MKKHIVILLQNMVVQKCFKKGVRQGCILSTITFDIIIDDIAIELENPPRIYIRTKRKINMKKNKKS